MTAMLVHVPGTGETTVPEASTGFRQKAPAIFPSLDGSK